MHKHKKLIALITAVTLTMAMSVNAFADPTGTSTGGVNETDTITNMSLNNEGLASRSTDVTVSRAGNFSVTIPKKITLPGTANANGKHETNYSITVKGDIGSTDRISVVPQASVTLKQANKTDVVAEVTQEAQYFQLTSDSSDTGTLNTTSHVQTVPFATLSSTDGLTVSNTGLVSAENLSAGTWSGTYTYNISLGEIPPATIEVGTLTVTVPSVGTMSPYINIDYTNSDEDEAEGKFTTAANIANHYSADESINIVKGTRVKIKGLTANDQWYVNGTQITGTSGELWFTFPGDSSFSISYDSWGAATYRITALGGAMASYTASDFSFTK